jgi:hypothetical protein
MYRNCSNACRAGSISGFKAQLPLRGIPKMGRNFVPFPVHPRLEQVTCRPASDANGRQLRAGAARYSPRYRCQAEHRNIWVDCRLTRSMIPYTRISGVMQNTTWMFRAAVS